MSVRRKPTDPLKDFLGEQELRDDALYPSVSVVVPAYQCAHLLPTTLDSLLAQQYPHLEILLVYADSTDRTFDVIDHYLGSHVRLYAVTDSHIFEMCNRGAALAQGLYLSFLSPGDELLTHQTLLTMAEAALTAQLPDLVYSGCRSHDPYQEPQPRLQPFALPLLCRGKSPTALQACWIRRDCFQKAGMFDLHYTLRGGFDLFCRLAKLPQSQSVQVERFLLDYSREKKSYPHLARYAKETLHILKRHFGRGYALRWLWNYDYKELARYAWKEIRNSLFGY